MDNFEMFLQLDDLKGAAAETAQAELESYRNSKEDSVERIENEQTFEDAPDFNFLEEEVMFEDEAGWQSQEEAEEDEAESTEEVEETEEEAESDVEDAEVEE
ncbi:hypothetical protein, partial [Herbiconiux daphne]